MHSDSSTTDQFYANHDEQELKKRILDIGNSGGISKENEEIFQEFEMFLAWKEAQKSNQ